MTRCLLAFFVSGLVATTAHAVLLDDFTETSDPGLFPSTQLAFDPLNLIADPIANEFGGLRVVALIPQVLTVPVPDPDAVTMTAGLDTTAGELTITASDEAAFRAAVVYYGADLDNPVGLDLTPLNRIVFEYSSSVEMELEVVLSNAVVGTTNVRSGFEATFVVPAASDGIYEVALMDVNELIVDVLSTIPPNPPVFFPPLDPTGLDAVTLIFNSSAPGASLTLRSISIIPEPRSVLILLAAAAGPLARRRS